MSLIINGPLGPCLSFELPDAVCVIWKEQNQIPEILEDLKRLHKARSTYFVMYGPGALRLETMLDHYLEFDACDTDAITVGLEFNSTLEDACFMVLCGASHHDVDSMVYMIICYDDDLLEEVRRLWKAEFPDF